jgi:hypothetical protein
MPPLLEVEKLERRDGPRLRVAGVNDLGDPIEFVALVPIGNEATGEERLAAAGITVAERDGKMFLDDVAFGSPAADAGLDWDQEVLRVLRPADQPSKYLMFIPALLLLGGVVMLQRRRAANGVATRAATA